MTALKNWKLLAGIASFALLFLALMLARADARHWHKQADAERAAHALDIANWKAESEKARTAQQSANARPAAVSAQIAEDSNAQSKVYYADGYRAGADYASAHRVPAKACPDQRESGVAGVSGPDQAAGQHDGPGDAPDMVAVSRGDFDTLTGNSLRLARVHQDAQALIDAGVAEMVSR